MELEITNNSKKWVLKSVSFFVALIMLQTGQIFANPVVIYDNGKTIGAQQFYPFEKIDKDKLRVPKFQKQTLQQFPVVSSLLSLGKVKSKTIISKLPRAICIVGDDPISKGWIKRNREKLTKLNALCVVVNVESKKVFKSIKSIAPNVEFQALNGDVFARQFNIYNYPALIHNGIVVQ